MVAYVRLCSYHCKFWHPYCQTKMHTILYIALSDHLLLSLSTSMQPHACSIPLPCSLHMMMTKMYHSCRKIYTFSSTCLKRSLAHDFHDIYFSKHFRASVFVLVRYILDYPLPIHYIKEEKVFNRITFTRHCLDDFLSKDAPNNCTNWREFSRPGINNSFQENIWYSRFR